MPAFDDRVDKINTTRLGFHENIIKKLEISVAFHFISAPPMVSSPLPPLFALYDQC